MNADARSFILCCLSDFLYDSRTVERPNVNWERAFAIAKDQSLDAILFFQCQSWMPKEIKRAQMKAYLAHAAISFAREADLKELLGHLQEENIPLLFFKGAVFRDYYPIPALRSMGDVDFVVHPENMDIVDRILRYDMHFQRFIDHQDVWTYWKNKDYIEVHTHMFYEYLANDVDYRTYFDKAWNHCYNASVFCIEANKLLIPEENYHFLYLMTHTAKHVTNRGTGFRPFLDMVLMTQKCADKLNWEYLEKELEKLRLLQFTKICFSLCEYWFKISMPLDPPELDEKFYEAMTEKTFSDGVFGLDNKENAGSRSAKELKRSNSPRWLAVLRLTWKNLFPPYEDLQIIPWYSFVDGRPWLLPAAWIYRWYYCLIHKRKSGTDLLMEPFIKQDIIVRREEWLRQWGL